MDKTPEKKAKPTEAKVEETKEVKAPVKAKKGSKRRHVPKARVYIVCSYNNTLINFTDMNGNCIGWSSSGSAGFKGTKKSTPFAATTAAYKAVEKVAKFGVKEVDVFIKGVGGGREATVRAIGNAGIQTSSIKDVTPVPHNGCRAKKPRRV